MNYSVGDFIIQIKNAGLAKRKIITVPYTNITAAIGKVLVKQGFLESIKSEAKLGRKVLVVTLKYEKRMPMLTDIALVSKPSLRVYTKAKNQPGKARFGVSIVSTSKGIMTYREAQKRGVGGEILFRIW